jgi:hypothetical protein
MGIVYLIQPGTVVGTNRYKVGASSNSSVLRIHKGYLKNTKVICIFGSDDPYTLENLIIQKFRKEFNSIVGREWFDGDCLKMRKLFIEMVFEFEKEQDRERERKEVEISREDVIVEKVDNEVDNEVVFVPSLRRFNINPNTNMYEKRVIHDNKSYIVSVNPRDWNDSNRHSIQMWLDRCRNIESTFPFGIIRMEMNANIYDIMNNHCEFCGKKTCDFKAKKRHMKNCRYRKMSKK